MPQTVTGSARPRQPAVGFCQIQPMEKDQTSKKVPKQLPLCIIARQLGLLIRSQKPKPDNGCTSLQALIVSLTLCRKQPIPRLPKFRSPHLAATRVCVCSRGDQEVPSLADPLKSVTRLPAQPMSLGSILGASF